MNTKFWCLATIGLAATFSLPLPALAAIEEGKLVVWINGDKGYKGLAEVGKRFTAETGIPVEVAHPDSATDKFQQAAATGNGPDIFIWAHDRIGEWAKSGLLTPVTPSAETKSGIADFSWQAVTYDNKLWGYPISVETIGLIYNKALVDTPPKSFDDVLALNEKLAAQGKRAILWDYNNTYFTWPLLSAKGGYVFEQTDGGYNVKSTGVNNAGAKAGAKVLRELIDKGVMPKGADYSVAEAAFNKGDSAMMISGPWAWSNIEKSGIDFGVAPIPAIDGEAGKPFVGVAAALLNAVDPSLSGTASGVPATDPCVISEGQQISDSTPPRLTESANSSVASANARAAASPPASRTETMPPKPSICRAASAWPGWSGSPG